MATVRENLIAAKALIDTPEKWTKGGYSAFVLGVECYCTTGALAKIYGVEATPQNCERGAEYDALRAELPSGDWISVVDFNDDETTTHADIMGLFDRAIAAQVQS